MNDRPDEFDDELTATVDRLTRLASGDDDASYVPLFMLFYNTAHSGSRPSSPLVFRM